MHRSGNPRPPRDPWARAANSVTVRRVGYKPGMQPDDGHREVRATDSTSPPPISPATRPDHALVHPKPKTGRSGVSSASPGAATAGEVSSDGPFEEQADEALRDPRVSQPESWDQGRAQAARPAMAETALHAAAVRGDAAQHPDEPGVEAGD